MPSETMQDRSSQQQASEKQVCDFVWYEFHTPDASAAESFYRGVLGWSALDAGIPDRRYTLISVEGTPIGGLLEKPVKSFADGAKPGWMGYIGVDNVDAYAKRVQEAGGFIHRAAEDIVGVGRFAVVADPQGAVFVLFHPLDSAPPLPRLAPGTPGTVAWHDLAAIDWQSDFAFYSDLFGWSKANTVEMGPAGVYQLFASRSEPIGGMMNRMDPAQSPGWLFYFNVDDIQAAVARAKEHGGTVVHGPSEVPGGQQIAHCLDTQGAIFGIVSPRI